MDSFLDRQGVILSRSTSALEVSFNEKVVEVRWIEVVLAGSDETHPAPSYENDPLLHPSSFVWNEYESVLLSLFMSHK